MLKKEQKKKNKQLIIISPTAYLRLWHQVFEAREAGDRPRMLKLLREATAGFVAITDVPGNSLIEEFQELYPDARVIVVRRDPERWWKSMKMIAGRVTPWWLRPLLAPCPGWRWLPTLLDHFMKAYVALFLLFFLLFCLPPRFDE